MWRLVQKAMTLNRFKKEKYQFIENMREHEEKVLELSEIFIKYSGLKPDFGNTPKYELKDSIGRIVDVSSEQKYFIYISKPGWREYFRVSDGLSNTIITDEQKKQLPEMVKRYMRGEQ